MTPFQRITSPQNSKVSVLRALQTTKGRAQERAWLIEGWHLLQEALRAQIRPQLVLYDADALAGSPALAAITSLPDLGVEIAATTDAIIARIAETQTPQGIVASIPMDAVTPAQLRRKRQFRERPITLILDDLRDPGNAGTILRSALAADVDAVLVTPHAVDIYAPKVVRAASGAHFSLPIYTDQSWDAITRSLRANKIQTIVVADGEATTAEVSLEYTTFDFTQPSALIIGNEAHGPSASARKLATHNVRIPMANGVESLNAAIAASILLFESVRQRSRP